MNVTVILANWLEDAWVGAASAAIFLLLGAAYRFLRQLSGRQIRDVSAEKPWKPGEDFHIEIKNDEDQAKPTSQNLPK